jgi:hypothetical protein
MIMVETGIADDNYIEIRSGISPGDEVVSGPYTAINRDLRSRLGGAVALPLGLDTGPFRSGPSELGELSVPGYLLDVVEKNLVLLRPVGQPVEIDIARPQRWIQPSQRNEFIQRRLELRAIG